MARAKMPHGGGYLPPWLSLRKDNEVLTDKMERIEKVIANGSSDYETVQNILSIIQENHR